jgi:hypothetical protein
MQGQVVFTSETDRRGGTAIPSCLQGRDQGVGTTFRLREKVYEKCDEHFKGILRRTREHLFETSVARSLRVAGLRGIRRA